MNVGALILFWPCVARGLGVPDRRGILEAPGLWFESCAGSQQVLRGVGIEGLRLLMWPMTAFDSLSL